MQSNILIIIIILLLFGHYKTQHTLFKIGIQKLHPKGEIKRLFLNGLTLMIIAIWAWMYYTKPFGLIGTFIFIESAVSFSFGNKLLKRNRMREG